MLTPTVQAKPDVVTALWALIRLKCGLPSRSNNTVHVVVFWRAEEVHLHALVGLYNTRAITGQNILRWCSGELMIFMIIDSLKLKIFIINNIT